MEKMQLLYHDLAKQKGSYVVNACGMDSVPADIGIIHFNRNFCGEYFFKSFVMLFFSNLIEFFIFQVKSITWKPT